MSPTRMSRREVLRGLSFTAAGAALAACAAPEVIREEVVVKETVIVEGESVEVTKIVEVDVEREVTAVPAALEANLTCYFGGWTPTDSMERTEDNPTPHEQILDVIDEYTAMHPGVTIEWLRIPQGTGYREWQIAQQMAGTIPHLTAASYWFLNEDTEKNWWVNLSPFLELPNPYISRGEAGSRKWLDQFYPVPMTELMMRGSYLMVALGAVTTMMFYNVDMFEEFGIKAPETYAEFLSNCQVCQDRDVIGYDGMTYGPEYGAFWYRVQFGGMIMARDIEQLVNPAGDATTPDEIACAIARGDWGPWQPQYREWMEKWKLNVPYRRADWTVMPKNARRLFVTKEASIMENGSWAIAELETDPLLDFEWSTYWSPTVTQETSNYVSDPPTPAWPIGGPVSDGFAVATTAVEDGVLAETIDLFNWLCVPDNVHKVQGEIGTAMPLVKDVPVSDKFAQPHAMLTSAIGESRLFMYEANFMDIATAELIGNVWFAYLLDQTGIDDAIAELTPIFEDYAEQYMAQYEPEC